VVVEPAHLSAHSHRVASGNGRSSGGRAVVAGPATAAAAEAAAAGTGHGRGGMGGRWARRSVQFVGGYGYGGGTGMR